MKEIERFELGEDENGIVAMHAEKIEELQRAINRLAIRCLRTVATLLGVEFDEEKHILKQEGDKFYLVVVEREETEE